MTLDFKAKSNIIIPLILGGIIAFSIIASVSLYSIQSAEFSKIAEEEAAALKNELSEKTFYVSQLASQHLVSVKKVLQIMTQARSFQTGEYDRIRLLLDAAQVDSSDIVDSFFILDKDGVLRYSTSSDQEVLRLVGTSLSNHTVYKETKENMRSFISSLSPALSEGSYAMYVASPIIDQQTGEFKGTVSASIRSDTFAKSIEKLVIAKPADVNSSGLSLIDPKGLIMYSGPSAQNLGKNVLSEEVLGAIPAGIKDGLVTSLREAVEGKSGIYELNLSEHPELMNTTNSGSSPATSNPIDYILISYTPVKVGDQIIMITLVTKSASLQTLLHQNEILGGSYMFLLIYGMLGSMTAFAIAIILINNRLTKKVQTRTKELLENNRQLHDATEEIKEQANKLKEADVRKAEFSAMITHELKTPLVSIIGYGSMFLNNSLGDLTPVQKQKLQIMFTDAERLAALIQDILDVQKLELGQMRLDVKQTSARNIIEQSINSLLPRAESKKVKLSNALTEDLVLDCDPHRIIQVLDNLIANGIKFSPSNSTIDINAKLEDHSVVFDVKDSGIGIPEEEHSRLFKKFYQVDTSLTRTAGGTGLGLVICKGIVEAHKGKIWFTSEAGEGSRFSFSIPKGEGVGK